VTYRVELTKRAYTDSIQLKKSGSGSYNKFRELLRELEDFPYTGTGHPEPLRYRPGCYSRRIDKKNRLIYRIDEASSTVFILSVMGHYDD
jgi:toxin YoeB